MAKNRYLAAFLSFLVAGLGQLYVGRPVRALCFFILDIITSYIYFNEPTSTIGFVLNLVIGLIAIVDAYRLAGKTEPAKQEHPEENKPEMAIKAY